MPDEELTPMATTQPIKVRIEDIRVDVNTQPRKEMDAETVTAYAERYQAGDNLPPVDLFRDGPYLLMADGRHRRAGAKLAGMEFIDAIVHEGTERDALLFAIAANQQHGKRLTTDDKIHTVRLVLADEEWKAKSTAWIAEHCFVSREFVENIRKSAGIAEGPRIGIDGKVREKKPKGRARQPGDDGADGKPRRKPGSEIKSADALLTAFGRVARGLTALGKLHRKERMSTEYEACRNALSTFAANLKIIADRIESGGKEQAA